MTGVILITQAVDPTIDFGLGMEDWKCAGVFLERVLRGLFRADDRFFILDHELYTVSLFQA
jgi:hypothetical protein